MTNNGNKTPEEQRIEILNATLKNKIFQDVIGSNLAKTNQALYGSSGLESANIVYDRAMGSEQIEKERKKIKEQEKKAGDHYGVFGEPETPSNYRMSLSYASQLEEQTSNAKLGELEKIVKEMGVKLGFEIPKILKDYSRSNISKKAMVNKEGEKSLSADEKTALGFYSILTEAYRKKCIQNATQEFYYADINKAGIELASPYNKEKSD